MSKVYSFRLNDENPREAQAREVIEAWVKEGYSLRYVIVEALLDYRQGDSETNNLNYVLKQLQSMFDNPIKINDESSTNSSLSNTFLAGIKKSLHKGIQA